MGQTAFASDQIVHRGIVSVVKTFGASCPAGYRAGANFRLDFPVQPDAFRCPAALEALRPYLNALAKTAADAPPSRFVATCHCPRALAAGVFRLYAYSVRAAQTGE